MAEFYQHHIAAWNVNTDDLELYQEAAYFRVVSAIRLYDRPFRCNMRVLSGLWRCNERRAKRILQELVDLKKLRVDDGWIIDERAVDDASTYRQLRADRKSAGRLGGIESGKSRAKALKDNEQGQAHASTLKKENKGNKVSSSSSSSAREAENDDEDNEEPVTLGDDAVVLYEAVMAAVHIKGPPIPRYWLPPAAIIHCIRWRALGLFDEEIIDVAKSCGKNYTDPPSGPKALDRAMQILASVKQMGPLEQKGQVNGKSGSQELQRSIERSAAGNKSIPSW